jgi:NAD+ synthase (glutamine-hydrolysing)
MRYTIAQIDSVVGDFSANAKKIAALAKQVFQNEKPDLLLFPEMSLCGYPPLALLDQSCFLKKTIEALEFLKSEVPADLAVGLGYVTKNDQSGKRLFNTYGIIHQGKIIFEQNKTLLPCYDFFDESRYFESAKTRSLFDFHGEKIGFAIGEDFCKEAVTSNGVNPMDELLAMGATTICVPSASPFYLGKSESRINLAKEYSAKGNVPVVYINAAGANDSVIFDGTSFAVAPSTNHSALTMLAPSFEETTVTWDDKSSLTEIIIPQKTEVIAPSNLCAKELDDLEAALVLGIKCYMQKCGFVKAHLGLSGGLDSALVLYLAVKAVGKDNVKTFGLPSHFSSEGSKDDARELAKNLDCHFEILPIASMYNSFMESLSGVFENRPFDTTEENLQARIRGTLMMAYSNKFNSLLLTTGNKSEVAMGYCTLYGDMNGGLNPIGDLFKTEVFAMCKRINQRSLENGGKIIIPESIIDKPPSAELRPDQKDQDSLPPYEVLDEILRLYLYEDLSKQEIVSRGWDEAIVTRVIKTTARSEFKRRQAAPILSVSKRPFGTNRKMPMARHLYEID